MPNGSNFSFITLTRKNKKPTMVKDFHPISLIGIEFKILAKILANTVAKVVDKLVGDEQSTFIGDR